MSAKHVVVVESPAKAKTINAYLGRDYTVVASFGHIRDLPAKDGSVKPDQDFAMDWEIDDRAKKQIAEIAGAVKGADALYLATDPDREGEAISWHVLEVLKARKVLKDHKVHRVVFNEITKRAVTYAIEHPRTIDSELVDAYLARRALDYLVGFTLSPVLWRKLPGARSAGRVQSVALRLVCEREMEIEAFRTREYWNVYATLKAPSGQTFTARLTELDGKKLERFDLANEAQAQAAADKVTRAQLTVASLETRRVRRNPRPPFTTSTLQQEAARKLGFNARRTMQVAQRLYEGVDIGAGTVGLITYMRTDGVQIANEAITSVREVIGADYGKPYVPGEPREYTAKAKNAQEAHEAIRPTDLTRRPGEIGRYLDDDGRRLYELIWKRTVASQMASAELEQATVDIAAADRSVMLRATGQIVVFDGFLALYQEGRDAGEDESEEDGRLPALKQGDATPQQAIEPRQSFTQPPPRYTEASLVKKLEELGIGRPSTYASILSTLRERDYVRMEKTAFIPEDRGRLVIAFLESYFGHWFEYDFTAKLEEQLDEISAGNSKWRDVLREFWTDFARHGEGGNGEILLSMEQAIANLDEAIGRRGAVIEAIDNALGPHFFPPREDGSDPRACPNCKTGRLGIKWGRNGGFIGCSNYGAEDTPCTYTRPLDASEGENGDVGPRELGTDPTTGEVATLRRGRFGPYVQLGKGDNGTKPKTKSLPRDIPADSIDLEKALALLSLPRVVGEHPETGKPIMADIGRYGPYIMHDGKNANLSTGEEALSIGVNHAVTLLAQPRQGRGRPAPKEPIRIVGNHPTDGAPIPIREGRFGPYLAHGEVFASLPRGRAPESITLDEAVELLAARAERGPSKGKRRGAAKTKAAPKAKAAAAPKPAPKAAAKKTAAPKRAAKSKKAG
jgi:DNA topoisomerase-1